MQITKDYLLKHRTKKNGWTKKQLSILGIDWPPSYEWMEIVAGNDIGIVDSKLFELNAYQAMKHEYQTFIGSKEKIREFHKPNKRKRKNKLLKKNRNFKSNKSKKVLFYKSRKWRELRIHALKICGRVCLLCGARPPDVRIHVDHIRPRSIYPNLELDITNLQTLCKDCNLTKSNKNCNDYRSDEMKKDAILIKESI